MLFFPLQTAFTASFALYHLARNQEKQEKMFFELKHLMSATESITEDMLQKSKYTKAVIKELHRMNPVSVGIGRILANDAVLSNYRVPAGVSDSHYGRQTMFKTFNEFCCRPSLLPKIKYLVDFPSTSQILTNLYPKDGYEELETNKYIHF